MKPCALGWKTDPLLISLWTITRSARQSSLKQYQASCSNCLQGRGFFALPARARRWRSPSQREIDLGEGEVTGMQPGEIASLAPTVTGEFDSPESASRFLEAIAENRPHGCAKVRVELVLANP